MLCPVNHEHLLEMIKDLKEAIEWTESSRVSLAHTTRPEVDSIQKIVDLCWELAARDEKTLHVALEGIVNLLAPAE